MPSIVDDLLQSGVVSQDPSNPNKVLFRIDVPIRKTTVNLGAFDTFAAEYGWSQGSQETSHAKCKAVVLAFIADVFKAAMLKKGERDGRASVEEMLKDLV